MLQSISSVFVVYRRKTLTGSQILRMQTVRINLANVRLSHGLQFRFRVSGQILVKFAIVYHIINIMRRQKSLSVSFKCFCKASMINSPNCLERNPPFLKCPMCYMVRVVIEAVYIINFCGLCRGLCAIRPIKVNRTFLIIQKAMLIP